MYYMYIPADKNFYNCYKKFIRDVKKLSPSSHPDDNGKVFVGFYYEYAEYFDNCDDDFVLCWMNGWGVPEPWRVERFDKDKKYFESLVQISSGVNNLGRM